MSALAATRPTVTTVVEPSEDRAAFDAYVRAHPQGSFFHLSGWGETVKRAYGYEPVYLIARRAGRIAGVLQLSDVRAPLTGRSLVSTAFSVGGGPLADDQAALAALLDTASDIAAARGAAAIECRSDFLAEAWQAKPQTHATFRLPVIKSETDALAAVPRKRRAEIRKALEAAASGDLSVRHDGEPALFHELYARSLHRLGTPVFPLRFLDALLDNFADATEITVADCRGRPVAALVTLYHGETALPYYVGAAGKARETRAFDYLYWSAMRRAAEKGCTVFDFGRSRMDSGAFHYKRLWGAEPAPVVYRIKPIDPNKASGVNASNPKYAPFTKLWPRLPLGLANRLGPLLAPNFP